MEKDFLATREGHPMLHLSRKYGVLPRRWHFQRANRSKHDMCDNRSLGAHTFCPPNLARIHAALSSRRIISLSTSRSLSVSKQSTNVESISGFTNQFSHIILSFIGTTGYHSRRTTQAPGDRRTQSQVLQEAKVRSWSSRCHDQDW